MPAGTGGGADHPTTDGGQTEGVLLVDAANVVGSRPDGWWRDRPGAARRLVEQLRGALSAARVAPPVVVVLEGKARHGVPTGDAGGITVRHAAGSGDDLLVAIASDTMGTPGQSVTLVSADRELCDRARAVGADVVGPGWLLDLLES
jgi:hypothetical protein